MIIEILYGDGMWSYPTDEPLGMLYFDVKSYFELFRIKEKIYLIHLVDSWNSKYDTTFYIIDNDREALEKFLTEVKNLVTDREIDTCEATKELKTTLTKHKNLLKSTQLRRFAEEIIQKCQDRKE